MLLDVMSGFDTIKICKAYKLDGKEIYGLPATVKDIERCEPVYEELPGWKEDITHVKSFEELPVNCQNYIRKIEELVHFQVLLILFWTFYLLKTLVLGLREQAMLL